MSTRKLANGKRTVIVNGALVARAITRKQLSVREVGRRTGLTFNIIYRITKSNQFSADLPLRALDELAATLDLTITELLDTAPPPAQDPYLVAPSQTAQQADSDAARLGRLMTIKGTPTRPEDIALAFGWSLQQLEAARQSLDDALEQTGLEVRYANGTYYLTSRGKGTRRQADDDHARVQLVEQRNKPMNTTVASILDDALNGRRKNQYREAEKPRLAEAVNVGYLMPGTPGEPELTPSPALLDAFPD